MSVLRQFELFNKLLRTSFCILPTKAIKPSNHRQILQAAQVTIHGGRLAGNTNDAPHFIRLTQDIVTGNRDTSAIRLQKGCQNSHGGRFAGAIGSKQR